MKSKVVLVAFLLMLYIGPMIFVSSYASPAILAEPNINKDFSLSEYGDESPQSITSFSETLPDDVLFYPDAIVNDTPHVADTGDDDYVDSQVLDSTYWSATGNSLEEAEFHLSTTVTIEGVNYAFYGHATVIEGWFKIQNDADSWVILETIATGGDSWYNGTVSDPDYFKTDNEIHFGMLGGDGGTIECDYLEIASVSYMTLADSDHYAESFTDVSDWSEDGNCDQTSYSTDGDVLSFEVGNNGGDDWDYLISDAFSNLTGTLYYEISVKINETNGVSAIRVYNEYPDDYRSINIPNTALDTWITMKGWIDESQVTRVGLTVVTSDGDSPVKIESDYFRISPSNETGWQHDGSTLEGVETEDTTISTDGDKLNISNAEATPKACNFWIDETTTKTTQSDTYYPFVEWSISNVSDASNTWLLRVYDDDGTYSDIHAYSYATGIFRINLGTIANLDNIKYFLFYVIANHWFELDYIKIYSIANFTVTQSSTTTDDYLYVDSGTLYSHIDDGYIEANHDPALDIGPHYGWAMSTSLGTPEIDFYNGAWLGYSTETEGEFSV